MSNSNALTKIQSIILIAVIVVAALGGAAAYLLLGEEEEQSGEPIKIGVCADLDQPLGRYMLQGARLAAEEINAEGGVLGRNFSIVAQDDDGGYESTFAISAFTKLITVDEADFIIASHMLSSSALYQEIAAEYERILFMAGLDPRNELTQNVLDDYDKYKYFFRTGVSNETATTEGVVDSMSLCRELTGFNKIAFMYPMFAESGVLSLGDVLMDYGFDVVLYEKFSPSGLDFSSNFAKVEAAGAEILCPVIYTEAGIAFVKEYYDRQSPMFMWGLVNVASKGDFWELTEGKCEHITISGYPVVAGYPLTTKTVPTREAYVGRWDEEITSEAASAYDTVRFILADAIERAGTIETDAVIEALEETSIETTCARNFVFTKSHDVMLGENPNDPDADYTLVMMFQWQDEEMVPVYPKKIMDAAEATYTYPPWDGPWNK